MRRRIVLGAVPTVLLGAIVLPSVLYGGDLPDPMAVHWSLSGDPNGSLPPLVLVVGLAAGFAAVWVSVVLTVRRAPRDIGSLTAGLYGIGGLLAAVAWISVRANRGVSDWGDAEPLGWAGLGILLGAAVLGGAGGWWLGGGRSERLPAVHAPRLEVDDPGHYVWSAGARSFVLALLGVGLIVAALVVWGWTGAVLALVGVLVLTFSRVRVTVSARGAVVGVGWLGVPSWTIPASEIAGGSVEHVFPMAYGGWGYRIRPGVRAVVIRGGQALRLHREGKPDLLITVDDAETGAGLVDALAGAR
jgi:hypothetical protein